MSGLRLETEALAAVVELVASSPDLDHVLGRVVDLLTRISGCHACFVYLVGGDRLKLRAASPVYARQVGRIEFGVDEGLAGWSVQHRAAAFIRDNAMDDPRTNYIPELEEQRFQSMAAVPIPSRGGDVLGVIVLHTAAPHEFDEGIVTVLAQTASVVAGAVENAKLYDEARRHVAALTRLSDLSRRIAAATRRAELYAVVTTGVRRLLPCDHCRVFELDGRGGLVAVAAEPDTDADEPAAGDTGDVLLEMLQSRSSEPLRLRTVVGRLLGADEPPRAALAVPVAAGSELLGCLVVGADRPWDEHADELLRAVAAQLAVALKNADIIESLSEEHAAHELFQALEDRQWETAAAHARKLGVELDAPHLVLDVRPLAAATYAPEEELRVERLLRQGRPGTICDAEVKRVRAIIPVGPAPDAARRVTDAVATLAPEHRVVVGAGTPRSGAPELHRTIKEAGDAARVAIALLDDGGLLRYDDMGADRYLVTLLDNDGPHDALRTAVDRLMAYDDERQTQLLSTLDLYLANGRSAATSARTLVVHVNTLRQRLDRIEALTGLDLASEDLLALQLAIRLARLRRRGAASAADASS